MNLNEYQAARKFGHTLASQASCVFGFTVCPDGARGGQPITSVPYHVAKAQLGVEFKERDICDILGKGKVWGL